MNVRLAWFNIPAVNEALADDIYNMNQQPPPTIRLAHCDGAQGDGALAGKEGKGPKLISQHAPALLVSYYYLEPFLRNREAYCYRDWVMDSGAFSAHNSGVKIDLNKYIDKCLELMETDPTLTEIFALDVIGDHEASLKNTEEMWRQGVPAIPCYHANEPEEVLYHIAKEYPKIALGGVALERAGKKMAWAAQCFARVWPKKIHGFAYCSPAAILGLPWHSVDATSWEIGPCAFGNWEKYGNMSVRGSNQDLRSQVKHYLDVEAKARVRWAKEMAQLAALETTAPPLGKRERPDVRLAINGPQMEHRGEKHVLGEPSVRLALLDQGMAAKVDMTSRAFLDEPTPAATKSPASRKKKEKSEPVAVSVKAEPKEVSYIMEDYWKNRFK